MSALLMLDTCEARSATVRAVSVTLRLMRDALRNLDGAEIERDHQRQQHREFDRRHAALVAAERRQPTGQIGEECEIFHGADSWRGAGGWPYGSLRNAEVATRSRLLPDMFCNSDT